MSQYRVLLNGQNFWMMLDNKIQQVGFYATRFVKANTSEEAKERAIQLIQNDSELQGKILNEESDPPMIYAEKIERLKFYERVKTFKSGFSFYLENEEIKH